MDRIISVRKISSRELIIAARSFLSRNLISRISSSRNRIIFNKLFCNYLYNHNKIFEFDWAECLIDVEVVVWGVGSGSEMRKKVSTYKKHKKSQKTAQNLQAVNWPRSVVRQNTERKLFFHNWHCWKLHLKISWLPFIQKPRKLKIYAITGIIHMSSKFRGNAILKFQLEKTFLKADQSFILDGD